MSASTTYDSLREMATPVNGLVKRFGLSLSHKTVDHDCTKQYGIHLVTVEFAPNYSPWLDFEYIHANETSNIQVPKAQETNVAGETGVRRSPGNYYV